MSQEEMFSLLYTFRDSFDGPVIVNSFLRPDDYKSPYLRGQSCGSRSLLFTDNISFFFGVKDKSDRLPGPGQRKETWRLR